MWKNSGQVESAYWLIGPLLIVGLVSIGAFFALQSYSRINLEIESGAAELQAINMENRLISSRDCLSTGEIGVLNASKLGGFEGSENILEECPPSPSVSYKVNVVNLSGDKTWTLGDLKLSQTPDTNRSISIATDSGVYPGKIALWFSTASEDLLLALRKNIASAWVTGSSDTKVELNDEYEITFSDGMIKNEGTGRELLLKIPGQEELVKVSNPSLTFSKGKTELNFKREGNKVEISTG